MGAAVRQQSPLSTSSMASMVVIMLSWLLVIALFTALSAAGCPAVLPPGEYDIELDLVQAREVRSVHLYVPDTVSSSVPAPVLFLQHGGGGDWESIRNMAHIEPYARKYGMIVAYARGLQSIILNFRTFNSGECCGRAKAKDIDELAYFDAVMASLEQNTCIDRSRVYVSGFSNGGMNSWRIMCGRSERVAAVAPVSGPLGNGFVRACGTSDTHRCALDPYQGECFDTSYNDGTTVCASPFTSPTQLHYRCDNISRAVPVMLFWGEKDQSVPFRGGLGINSVEEFVNPPVSMTVKFMADLYGCARPPKLTFENKTATDNATCYTYTECARAPSTNDLFSYCVAEENAHAWPGGLPYDAVCNPDLPEYNRRRCDRIRERRPLISYNIDASEQMMQFFLRHSL